MQPSKYSFELWSRSGVLLADLAGRAAGRRVTMSRNEAEDISWTLDLNEFENYCRTANVDPATLLQPNNTEVRIRRGQEYLCGGKLIYRNINITPTAQTIELRATGFLNLFKRRFTDASQLYTATQATAIAWDLINHSQSQGANWNFGVTVGSLATVGVHDRTYADDEIKKSLQDLTAVQTAPFDFAFTPDKIFNTYDAIGSLRPELVFEYPGNIKQLGSPLDGTLTANHIRVLGSGSGTEGSVRTVTDDFSSQANYNVLEEKMQESSVIDVNTLTDHGNAELAAVGNPFEIPALTVDGNLWPFVTDYGIGDYVTVRAHGYSLLSGINALYRIEKIDLQVDDNDLETVTLYVSR